MLRIRLRRTGRKNRPHYRIVVAEHSATLTGKFVDGLGHFDPRTKEIGVDQERLTKWLGVGAKPSNRVAKILTTAGVSHKFIVVKQRAARAPRHPEKPAATAPAAQPAEATESIDETPVAEGVVAEKIPADTEASETPTAA